MMQHLPRNVISSHAQEVGMVIDHLVAALGNDAACTMRRAQVLTDIDAHDGTTQSAILKRLGFDNGPGNKSAMTRDVDWLYNMGCITRTLSPQDAREIQLRTVGYSKTKLALALKHFGGSHQNLQNFLTDYINIFGKYRPTLRDAKILAVVRDKDAASRKMVLSGLYREPSTTESRALGNLVTIGILDEEE